MQNLLWNASMKYISTLYAQPNSRKADPMKQIEWEELHKTGSCKQVKDSFYSSSSGFYENKTSNIDLQNAIIMMYILKLSLIL